MSDLCPVAVSKDSGNLVEQPKTAGESHLLLLKQKKYCDVTFKFPNLPNRIPAHEIYLKARSPVFEQIFRLRKSGNVHGNEIAISESTPETFQQLLEFIYADKFEEDIAGALDLLQLAQKYKIQPLTEKCEELLRTEIKAEESVQVFEAARCHGRQDLMDRSEIIVKSFSNLMETGALANADEETLVYLLERDDLKIEEVKLFQLILDWGKIQVGETGEEQTLKDKLKNLISKIRYTNMTQLEFTKVVVPTGLLSAEESLSVYSYLCGDKATRAALKIKFNTTGRRAWKVEKFVDFFVGKQFQLDYAHAFRCQYLYFKVERKPEEQVVTKDRSASLQKTAFISRIKFLWPKTSDRHELASIQKFSIVVKEKLGSHNSSTVYPKTKLKMRLSSCDPGISDEIDVKPPVELIPGYKYVVIVQNNLSDDPHDYYGHVLPTSDHEASRDIFLENGCLEFKEIHLGTNYYRHNPSNSPFHLVLIKGITIELV